MPNTGPECSLATSVAAPLQVAVGVIRNPAGEILVTRRNDAAHQGGLWEFPGGKVEPGETVQQALLRELREELAIGVLQSQPLIRINHTYPDLQVQLDVWSVEAYSGVPASCEGQPLQWLAPDRLTDLSFPEANLPIITAARLPEYYAILQGRSVAELSERLLRLLQRGIKLIQLRAKSLSKKAVARFLSAAYPMCRQQGARLLVNSAMLAVAERAADGVHLTSRHLLQLQARPDHVGWLAASCHNPEELQHAEEIGVDFAVLAPVLPTASHPGARTLGWQRFSDLLENVNLPVYALGGMTLDDVKKARQAGAQGVAGIGMFQR